MGFLGSSWVSFGRIGCRSRAQLEDSRRFSNYLGGKRASAVGNEEKRKAALLQLQVTTRSPMGAIVYESGGILVDGGWLRLLGSGSARLPRSLPEWNQGRVPSSPGAPPPFLIVADDVMGGSFAVDGGGLTGSPGVAHYFAPDSLQWESLDQSYSSFLDFAFTGDLEQFYQDSRWPGWREEIAAVDGGQGISVYPFLFTEGPPLAERSRKPVPIAELWRLQQDIASQVHEPQ